MNVALVHDYLTQRGGAERVVLSMVAAFPDAVLYTSMYAPATTFSEFEHVTVRTTRLDTIPGLRANHRLALPLLAPAFERLTVEADVVVCSSSGWAHGVRATAPKIVYCHTPAHWLYTTRSYVGRSLLKAAAVRLVSRPLVRWDRRAAATAQRYLANSTVVRERIRRAYGIDAEVLPAPHRMRVDAPRRPVDGLEPGFLLCVSRLLPYKNADVVARAFAELPGERLVIVGQGPEAARIRRLAPRNVRLLGTVSDEQLRWLYANGAALVAASREDYGLTPLEAAALGTPTVALRAGGFLDTVIDGETGVFFDAPTAGLVARAVRETRARLWDREHLQAHAERFSEGRFVRRLTGVVAEAKAAA